jgi:hypothetical protein
VKSNQ